MNKQDYLLEIAQQRFTEAEQKGPLGTLLDVATQHGVALQQDQVLPKGIDLDTPCYKIRGGYNGKRPEYLMKGKFGFVCADGTHFGNHSSFTLWDVNKIMLTLSTEEKTKFNFLSGDDKIELVVTRHPALLEYLQEIGVANETTEIVSHVTSPEVVAGKFVCGVLPHNLSCYCKKFMEIPLTIPAEARGKELTLEEVRQYAGSPQTYVINKI